MAADSATLSNAVKTMYSKELELRALPRLVHGRWGKVAQWTGYGTYETRRWEAFSAITTTLSEGNDPLENAAPSITIITLTPNWYGSWITYTDKMTITAYDPAVAEIVGLFGEQAGLSVDTLIRNALTDAATKDYSGGATARTGLDVQNDTISFVDLVQNVAQLDANNALPVEGMNYVLVLHPHTVATLLQDSTFVTLLTREGGQGLRSGKLGNILNLSIYVSSNARIYTDAGQNSTEEVYEALFIGRESHVIAGFSGLFPNLHADNMAGEVRGGMTGQRINVVDIIVKGLGEAGTGLNPLNMRGTIGWKLTNAQTVLQSTWMRSLEHVNDFS